MEKAECPKTVRAGAVTALTTCLTINGALQVRPITERVGTSSPPVSRPIRNERWIVLTASDQTFSFPQHVVYKKTLI
jgi:hypothetical protein